MNFQRPESVTGLFFCEINIKNVKKHIEKAENEKTILKIFWLHTVVFLLGIIFAIANFI